MLYVVFFATYTYMAIAIRQNADRIVPKSSFRIIIKTCSGDVQE